MRYEKIEIVMTAVEGRDGGMFKNIWNHRKGVFKK